MQIMALDKAKSSQRSATLSNHVSIGVNFFLSDRSNIGKESDNLNEKHSEIRYEIIHPQSRNYSTAKYLRNFWRHK